MTEKDNPDMLDGEWMEADDVWIRHCQQKSRTDEEAQILRACLSLKITPEEAAKKLNTSVIDVYRKEIIYLGSDPKRIKEFEEDFGVKF